jgi:uncharacterized DUF497 family protein
VRWTWEANKSAANRAKPGLSFEIAVLVFDDPLPDGDRWHTIGRVGSTLLLVVHTWPEPKSEASEPVGRIVSARRATARERKAYGRF